MSVYFAFAGLRKVSKKKSYNFFKFNLSHERTEDKKFELRIGKSITETFEKLKGLLQERSSFKIYLYILFSN